VNVVVLADTHLRAGAELLPQSVLAALSRADLVIHAGDVVSRRALEELQTMAPIHAVLGNNDHELDGLLPPSVVVDLEGVRVAVVHDSGARQGRPNRLHRRFPDADIVVFGHSHVPCDELGVEGQVLFNPGSPTQRRKQPHPTMGTLTISDGRIRRRRIEAV
jgi:putative phosphoesterase